MLSQIFIYAAIFNLIYPLLKLFYKCLKYLYCQFHPINLQEYGSWAVITGGSDGIGKAYALQLAKKGLNILVIARTESKLNAVCREAINKYRVEADYIVFDFLSESDSMTYDELKLAIQHKDYYNDIGILVNNVGTLPYAYESYFEKVDDFEKLQSLNNQNYKINIKSQSLMTAIILPAFYKKSSCQVQRKQKGIIVNLSSVASTKPQGFWTLYSCAKAYNYYFSESLRKEFQKDKINIISQTVRPAVVCTSMAPKFAKESYRFPTAETFCKYAVNTIGFFDVTNGYWFHSLLCWGIYLVEGFDMRLVYGRVKKIRAARARRAAKIDKHHWGWCHISWFLTKHYKK